MAMDDLSYLEQLMGSGVEGPEGSSGGVWVVDPDGGLDEGLLRLVGKARVVADALGSYVYLVLTGEDAGGAAQRAIQGGADQVLLASGVPAVNDLAAFFGSRSPQAVLFPRTPRGRVLGAGLAQVTGGSLCGYAADLAVDTMTQRLQAHLPVLDDAARQVVTLLRAPAVVVLDTGALPAAFSEPWRSGQVEETGLTWAAPVTYPEADFSPAPVTLANAAVVVGVGRGLRSAEGVALATRLAQRLGGVLAGDLGALDAGWIGEDQLLGLTGHRASPKLYLALGIDGDTGHLAAVQGAGAILAVQADPAAPITAFADWNVIADPAVFAKTLLARLGEPDR
ncbi:MAG TPA: FAD-binding protein [Anaerolineae bacterium]